MTGTGMSQFVAEILTNPSIPVAWQNKRTIAETMNRFIASVQQRKIKMPKIKWLENQLRALTYDEAYGNEHMPDGVASLLMAWYAKDRILKNFHIGGGSFL